MSAKEQALKMINTLPDEATLDDIIHALCVRAKFDEGEGAIREGKGIPHEAVKKILYEKYVLGKRPRRRA